jgi:hypothetical protein
VNKAKGSPTVATMKRRMLALYAAASPETVAAGTCWYDEAHAFALTLAERYQVTVQQAACVIAAHSMNASWKMNVRRAEAHLAGEPWGLGAAKAMAAAALANPDDPFRFIVGAKIHPFAHNVAGDLSMVATDRWMQRAGFNTDSDQVCAKLIGRNGVRAKLIEAIAKAAADIGIAPAILQAIIWVHVRGSAD